jgi:exonuclease III
LKICHNNVEGIFISKSEYLARLMREEKEDIIAVQETHAVSEENLRKRETMSCYVFIGAIYSRVQFTAS